MDEVICDKCGREMVYKKVSSTQGWFCEFCGWNVVTSFSDPIDEDIEIYEVFNFGNNKKALQEIKCISKITGENFIKCKELLSSNGQLLYKGNAKSVKVVLQKLKKNNIRFNVIPYFPYSID